VIAARLIDEPGSGRQNRMRTTRCKPEAFFECSPGLIDPTGQGQAIPTPLDTGAGQVLVVASEPLPFVEVGDGTVPFSLARAGITAAVVNPGGFRIEAEGLVVIGERPVGLRVGQV